MNVTLWEAWSLWLSGNSITGLYLWGIQILWWGRIGKFVAFVAGLTIVAEIVGPARLRNIGNKLHAKFTLGTAKSVLVATQKWYWGFMKSAGRSIFKGEAFDIERAGMMPVSCFTLALGYVVTGGFIYYIWSSYNWWRLILIGWLCLGVFTFLLAPLSIVALTLLLTICGLLIDAFIIEPVAYVLEIEYLDKGLKIGGLLLFFIGFHFDLLAS